MTPVPHPSGSTPPAWAERVKALVDDSAKWHTQKCMETDTDDNSCTCDFAPLREALNALVVDALAFGRAQLQEKNDALRDELAESVHITRAQPAGYVPSVGAEALDYPAAIREAQRVVDEFPKLIQPSLTDYNLARCFLLVNSMVAADTERLSNALAAARPSETPGETP